MDQGLLIRNPSLTREEFSHHWYNKHAPLVIPMFLYLGVQHYQQVPSSLLPSPPLPSPHISPPIPLQQTPLSPPTFPSLETHMLIRK